MTLLLAPLTNDTPAPPSASRPPHQRHTCSPLCFLSPLSASSTATGMSDLRLLLPPKTISRKGCARGGGCVAWGVGWEAAGGYQSPSPHPSPIPINLTHLCQRHENQSSHYEVARLAVHPVEHRHQMVPQAQRVLDLHLLDEKRRESVVISRTKRNRQ